MVSLRPKPCFTLSLAVYETPQEARPVRAFLYLAVYLHLPLDLPTVYASLYADLKLEPEAYTT